MDDGTTLAVSGGATLDLGDRFFLGHHGTVAARRSVRIGQGPSLTELVSMREHDLASSPSAGVARISEVTIGNDLWLASKGRVLHGSTVGERSVADALAVVRRGIPAAFLTVSVPAGVVRSLGGQPMPEHPT